MNIIEVLEQEQLRSDIPDFRAGDTVKVYVKVVEGTRERVQMYELHAAAPAFVKCSPFVVFLTA